MTLFKYLVPIFGLLVAGSAGGWAADDTADSGAATTTAASADAGSTHKSHHRKHHAKSTTTTTNAGAATAPEHATPPLAATSTPSTSSPRKAGAPTHAAPPAETASTPAKAAAPSAAKPAQGGQPAAATAVTTRHSRRHHGAPVSTAGAATNTATAPSTAAAAAAGKLPAAGVTPPSTNAPAGAAPTLAQGTNPAATGKGRHHRHGKTATPGATSPALGRQMPPIVVPQTPASLAPAQSATAVTLPTAPPISESKPPASAVPTVQTDLPVARPGAGTTATLPIAPIRTPTLFNFPFKDFPPQRPRTRTYPWKSSILTTVFWIGEGATPISAMTNKQSAWDMNWVHNNGGADDPSDMSGYASGGHASMLNPFYVALPFNDLAYPDKTSRWLPSGWYKGYRHGDKPVSSCQGRWIEIKMRTGRYCFAQWEDVGPIVTDDAEYVFGPERPSANRGLDVSPAVAKYLGIPLNGAGMTSWRFVDDGDVLPGMWLRYDEQALLLRAIKEQMHGSPTPRIQELEEPLPDPDDSTQKKAGAARG